VLWLHVYIISTSEHTYMYIYHRCTHMYLYHQCRHMYIYHRFTQTTCSCTYTTDAQTCTYTTNAHICTHTTDAHTCTYTTDAYTHAHVPQMHTLKYNHYRCTHTCIYYRCTHIYIYHRYSHTCIYTIDVHTHAYITNAHTYTYITDAHTQASLKMHIYMHIPQMPIYIHIPQMYTHMCIHHRCIHAHTHSFRGWGTLSGGWAPLSWSPSIAFLQPSLSSSPMASPSPFPQRSLIKFLLGNCHSRNCHGNQFPAGLFPSFSQPWEAEAGAQGEPWESGLFPPVCVEHLLGVPGESALLPPCTSVGPCDSLRMTLNSWPSCLYLPSTRNADGHHPSRPCEETGAWDLSEPPWGLTSPRIGVWITFDLTLMLKSYFSLNEHPSPQMWVNVVWYKKTKKTRNLYCPS
jgi:hypothetical protein